MREPGSPPPWLTAVDDDPAYGWARIAWRRSSETSGAWFDHAKADAAVALWPKVFRLTEDRFAGKPFRLNTWQEIVVRLVVGWKHPVEVLDEITGAERIEHVRLFQELRLWVPRKNGKSEFLAALSLLFYALEGPVAGQGFVFARDEKQAKIVFDKMKAMIAFSPQLAKRITAFKKSLWIPEIRAAFELLTGKAEGKHGRSPTVITGDEIHEWTSLELKTTLRQGTGARLQPIGLYASTAGLKDAAIGYSQWEESRAIMDGRIEDPTTLVVIFAAEPDDDWLDEAVWRKANPSLGLSPTLAFLRREAALAKDNPRAESHFRRYHLNQWVDSLARWLNIKRWDACTADAKSWPDLWERMKGRRCFLALDVSSTQDVTALILLFPPEDGDMDGRWTIVCRFWVPEDTVTSRVTEDRVPYDKWVASGALETTPGDYVDQNYMMKAIIQALADFDVQRIGFDPWNARKLVTDLEREGADPELFLEMRQGIPTLGEPTKQFERMVYAAQFEHGGHPVLRWMAGNTVVRFDENMNFAPAKKKSGEKIDGIVGGVMTVGLAFAGEGETGMSDYLSSLGVPA